MLQRLAVMTVRSQGEMAYHLRHFVAQHGNLARIAAVGRRGPQTQESLLAGQAALGVEMLDADIIEMPRPVNGRHQVRLGDEDDIARAALTADVARKGAVRARRLPVAAAQNPQA